MAERTAGHSVPWSNLTTVDSVPWSNLTTVDSVPWSNFVALWLVASLIAFAPPTVAISVSVLSSRCRGFAVDSVAASALRNKLCAAHAAANKVRLLTTLTALSVAWIIGVYANASFILEVELHPRGTVDVFLGILAAALGTTIDRSRKVAFGILTVVYQAMLLLSCRPLDKVGVRMVGLVLGLEYLYCTAAFAHQMPEERGLWGLSECAGTRYAFLALRSVWGLAFATSYVVATWSCSSRLILQRLWLIMRISCPTALLLPTTHGLGLFWGDCAVMDDGTPYPLAAVTGNLVWSITGTVVFTLLLTARNRGRLSHSIAGAGLTEESRNLAAVGALLGASYCEPINKLVDEAVDKFIALPFSALTINVLRPSCTQAQHDATRSRLRRVAPGEIDAVVSHSWADDAEEKYNAIKVWAEAFEKRHGREPLLWVDKFCVDQMDIQRSLRGLPIYVFGSRELLVLAGPTYCSRLWCILEIFCFLTLRGDVDAITIHRLNWTSEGPEAGESLERQLSAFQLSTAKCSLATDRDCILSTIEAVFGRHEAFNEVVRMLFARRGTLEWKSLASGLPESICAGLRGSTASSIIVDEQERIVAVNSAWTRMCGFPASEALGKSPKLLQARAYRGSVAMPMCMCLLTPATSFAGTGDRHEGG